MEITFINLINSDQKELDLNKIIESTFKTSKKFENQLFIVNDYLFKKIEGFPLAYYAPISMLTLSAKKSILKTNKIIARQGIGASIRFHRLIWEVPCNEINIKWLHMVHGSTPLYFYKPTTHLFLWENNGIESKMDVIHRYPYLNGNYGFKIQAEEYYQKPGLCYGKRTENFTVQIMPSGHVFSFEGTAIFNENDKIDIWELLALLNSAPINNWLSIVCAEHKAYNYVESLPIPNNFDFSNTSLSEYSKLGWRMQVELEIFNINSPHFCIPALIKFYNQNLSISVKKSIEEYALKNKSIIEIKNNIDVICYKIYEIKTFISLIDDEKPSASKEIDDEIYCIDNMMLLRQIIDYIIGITFARWDIRYATGEKTPPELPDPFAPLPVCPPGMLQNSEGLPAAPEDVPGSYPLRLTWSGIIVDDEGHKEDIVSRVREAMEVIWKDKAADIEHEACEILGIKSLRDYFRNPNNFFAQHLKRYSKSRRQAPIYWPLSTASGAYTLWLYYHRLTDQTLYTCVNDFVDPKIKLTDETIEALRRKTARSRLEEAELEKLTALAAELKDFREELLRIAKFWKPDLNDGVQITAAPLWDLFALRPWKKTLKETWAKLEKGDYDWAHLAYSIRPERVKEKCRTDKSLAIAHDLEHLYEEPKGKPKKKRAQKAVTGDLEIEETEGAE